MTLTGCQRSLAFPIHACWSLCEKTGMNYKEFSPSPVRELHSYHRDRAPRCVLPSLSFLALNLGFLSFFFSSYVIPSADLRWAELQITFFFWWLRVKIFLRFLLNLLTVSLRGSRVFRFLCVFLKKEKRGDLRSKLSKIDLRDHTRVLQTPRTLCRWCGRISRLIIAAVVFQHFSRKLFCF